MPVKNELAFSETALHDFNEIKKSLSETAVMAVHELSRGESTSYAACHFKLNGKAIAYRSAKITPTKTGQFVAIWKRDGQRLTQPYDENDDLDFMVISCRSRAKFGFFLFPKSVLIEQGIMSSQSHPGKRGIRVYPRWDATTSRQAKATQNWQGRYFISMGDRTEFAFTFFNIDR